MKITKWLEKVIEGDPKIWNNIYIDLSNTLDTFMIFEAELCGLVGKRYDYEMVMTESSVIYSIRKVKRSKWRKFVKILQKHNLDLIPMGNSAMQVIVKSN